MASVPQRTLSWLYSVLGKSYRDPNRTYSDCAQLLSQYPNFAPRTDVYTFENGSSALLVRFVGTIPVTFRGATYRFPIALWIPYGHPQEAPLVYVTPTEQMSVRPGQHVSGDGRVYHHYLAQWGDAWDRSNLLELLSILSDVFAREPPVVSKQQATMRPPLQQQGPGPPPPVPPLPQELQQSPPQVPTTGASQPSPPAPPPKESGESRNGIASPPPQRPSRYDAPPPLPPHPGAAKADQPTPGSSYSSGMQGRQNASSQYVPARNSSLRQSMSPQRIQDYSGGQQYQLDQARDPRTSMSFPGIPGVPSQPLPPAMQSYDHYRQPEQQQPAQQPFLPDGRPQLSQYPPHTTQQSPPYLADQQHHPPPQQQQHQQQQQQQQPQPRHQPQPAQPQLQQHHQPPPQQPKPKPPPNLLDSPFDISLPVSTSNLPAPPIPRNPEKDALLSTLSSTLTQNLRAAIAQNTSALPYLQSQHSALSNAQATLTSELDALTTLSTTLGSNISILQSALHSSNAAIAAAQSRAAKGDIPNVDEMLTAPTVVGKQLYDVVCEERGIEAGIWALQEGFVRGRISLEVWARKTRELSRERFRRRWLADKIGRGMGLEA